MAASSGMIIHLGSKKKKPFMDCGKLNRLRKLMPYWGIKASPAWNKMFKV